MATIFQRARAAVLLALMAFLLMLGLSPQIASANNSGVYAVVNFDGSFVRGANVTATTHLGPGRYEITFNQNVSQCAYIATIGDPAHALVFNPGLICTAGGHASNGGPDPMGVYVETKNLGGGLSDWPFHLNVTC